MPEATNELAFLCGRDVWRDRCRSRMARRSGSAAWKYGFKSAKSIVRISFTDQQPKTFWEPLQASEYGFWANVNPAVPHPRWSQAEERLIGTGEIVPTQI